MSMGSSNGDITVVITCFNYGAYLEEAFESLETQTGGPPSIVVIDDGSTDAATLAVLDRLDTRAEIVHQSNRGAAAARSTGLARADTAFVLALDADDRLAPGSLEALRGALDEHPDAGYAYGYIEFFGGQQGVMRMPPFDPWRLLFRHIVGPSALMRRELVEAVGGYDPSYHHYEDWEIWLHALAEGWSGVQVPRSVLLYRKHGSSKYDADRAAYGEYFRRLRAKHWSLYGNLASVRARSRLGFVERQLYRWVWGHRPWPASLENRLYSLRWRASTSTQSTDR